MTDKYTHSILKERGDYAVFVRELPSTVQTLFALEWRRVKPPRSCHLMDCEIVEVTITPQEALAWDKLGVSFGPRVWVRAGRKAHRVPQFHRPVPQVNQR